MSVLPRVSILAIDSRIRSRPNSLMVAAGTATSASWSNTTRPNESRSSRRSTKARSPRLAASIGPPVMEPLRSSTTTAAWSGRVASTTPVGAVRSSRTVTTSSFSTATTSTSRCALMCMGSPVGGDRSYSVVAANFTIRLGSDSSDVRCDPLTLTIPRRSDTTLPPPVTNLFALRSSHQGTLQTTRPVARCRSDCTYPRPCRPARDNVLPSTRGRRS